MLAHLKSQISNFKFQISNLKSQISNPRRICFVTGTRAEFGLMQSTLRAIQESPRLTLQLIATGMHCDPAHGGGVKSIRAAG